MIRKNRYTLPCVYEGAVIEWCNTCNGEMRHVRDCEKHEKCTRGLVSSKVTSCIRCPDYAPDKSLFPKEGTPPVYPTPQNSVKEATRKRREELKQRLLAQARRRQTETQAQAENTPSEPVVPIHQRLNGIMNRAQQRRLALRQKVQQPNGQPPLYPTVHKIKVVQPRLNRVSDKPEIKWACAVTTVPQRRTTTLPRTIVSILSSGFPSPHLFIDVQPTNKETGEYPDLPELVKNYQSDFGLPFTFHSTNIRTFGNWYLALLEMYIRNPHANRYAVFQDDIVLCKDLREYLEQCQYPERGYLNLMTFPQNEAEKFNYFEKGTPEEKMIGWYPSNQKGKSATGYVFDRQTLLEVLQSEHLHKRIQDERKGHQNIDGAMADTMRMKGYTEYVHSPSLIRHIGTTTTMGNEHPQKQPLDLSFRGENWSALEVLNSLTTVPS